MRNPKTARAALLTLVVLLLQATAGAETITPAWTTYETATEHNTRLHDITRLPDGRLVGVGEYDHYARCRLVMTISTDGQLQEQHAFERPSFWSMYYSAVAAFRDSYVMLEASIWMGTGGGWTWLDLQLDNGHSIHLPSNDYYSQPLSLERLPDGRLATTYKQENSLVAENFAVIIDAHSGDEEILSFPEAVSNVKTLSADSLGGLYVAGHDGDPDHGMLWIGNADTGMEIALELHSGNAESSSAARRVCARPDGGAYVVVQAPPGGSYVHLVAADGSLLWTEPVYLHDVEVNALHITTTGALQMAGKGIPAYSPPEVFWISEQGELLAQRVVEYPENAYLSSSLPAPDYGSYVGGFVRVNNMARGQISRLDPLHASLTADSVQAGGGLIALPLEVDVLDVPATELDVRARAVDGPGGAGSDWHSFQALSLDPFQGVTPLGLTLPVSDEFADGDYTLQIELEALDEAWTKELTVPLHYLAAGMEEHAPALPKGYSLGVYPNPFNGTTTLSVALPAPGPLAVTVHDLLGRPVRTLHDGPATAGELRLVLDGTGLASGTYLLRAESAGQVQTRRITLVK